MNQANDVAIIGIGDDGAKGLTQEALSLIQGAELLFGGERHLAFFSHLPCEKIAIKSNLKEASGRINRELGKKKMAVLASGDPLFYGIGKYLLAKVPKDQVRIFPAVSSMQIAFARIKESWEDATIISLHARSMEESLNAVKLNEINKIGLLTDEKNTPNAVAKSLQESGNDGQAWRAFVCENLGGEDEKITEGSLDEISKKRFSPLNVMILIKKAQSFTPAEDPGEDKVWSFGIPDAEFYQRTPEKGLITKSEVRVISLSKMKLLKNSIVWDIGAGSGSVSIESGLLAPQGKVFAIEKNAEDCDLILKNMKKFRTGNVTAIQGMAPECLAAVADDPDAVFIGGSAGNMEEILRICSGRLKSGGRIVVNVITLENLSDAWEAFKKLGLKTEATLLQASRSQPILDLTRLAAMNPIFIITAFK